MSLLRRENGEGRAGTLIGLTILAVTIYLGVKIVPVLVNGYAFRDYLEEEARFAALRSQDDVVRTRIVRKAQELDLPVPARSVLINRTQTYIDIKVKYVVPIETPVYTYDMIFDEAARAPLF
jgi:hypothetical protein